jgi:rhodanese-related sulfurtransferase
MSKKWWSLLVLIVIVLAASACRQAPLPSPPSPGGEATATGISYKAISSAQLASMLQEKNFLLINVHIPYAGEIEVTDLFIPYDEVDKNIEKLPIDRTARIVVYCLTGPMSSVAAARLVELGYSQVSMLEGGMKQWQQDGYPLLQKQ